MNQVVAATLHKGRKVYYWRLPEGAEPPIPGSKVLVETQGGIAPARVVEVLQDPEMTPTASLVQSESYGTWRKAHPSQKQTLKEKELRQWIDAGIDPGPYKKAGYTAGQLREVRMGLEMGLNVSAYADPVHPAREMRLMRREQMLKVAKALRLIPDGLTDRQAQEVINGLEQNVDISQYNDPSLSWGKMKKIRRCLLAGAPAEGLRSLTKKQLDKYLKELKNHANKKEADSDDRHDSIT